MANRFQDKVVVVTYAPLSWLAKYTHNSTAKKALLEIMIRSC